MSIRIFVFGVQIPNFGNQSFCLFTFAGRQMVRGRPYGTLIAYDSTHKNGLLFIIGCYLFIESNWSCYNDDSFALLPPYLSISFHSFALKFLELFEFGGESIVWRT